MSIRCVTCTEGSPQLILGLVRSMRDLFYIVAFLAVIGISGSGAETREFTTAAADAENKFDTAKGHDYAVKTDAQCGTGSRRRDAHMQQVGLQTTVYLRSHFYSLVIRHDRARTIDAHESIRTLHRYPCAFPGLCCQASQSVVAGPNPYPSRSQTARRARSTIYYFLR